MNGTSRPSLHFTAESGWINDPHGVTFSGGLYHLFYQYVPDTVEWASNCHWGHATSEDLLTWSHHPVALAPGDGDDGIWTGCIVVGDDGEARIFYTAIGTGDATIGRIRSAHPADSSWDTWIKGPVVAQAPREEAITAFRDPFVWRTGDDWRMVVGASMDSAVAATVRYTSSDLMQWTLEGISPQRAVTATEPVWTGSMWECPQLFEIDGRWILLVSAWHEDVLYHVAYSVGDMVDGEFVPQTWARLTYGPSYYAPSFFRDKEGHPSLLFWLRGIGDAAAGWVGAHSVAYRLTLVDNDLIASPHPALERLRMPGSSERMDGPCDVCWEPHESDTLSVRVDDGELCDVTVEGDRLALRIGIQTWAMPYMHGPIRILIDGPTLEISATSGLLSAPLPRANGRITVATESRARVWSLAP